MPGFQNVRQVVDAELGGATHLASFRKVPAQSVVTYWFDLSMSPGSPPNYYIGPQNAFTPLAFSTDYGLNVGPPVAPAQKHLRRITLMPLTNATPSANLVLLDYIGFYGFIDEGVSYVDLVNTNRTPATRSYDGKNVQMVAVIVGGHSGAAGRTFTVTYTNSAGVAGRVTQPVPFSAGTVVPGAILTSNAVLATWQYGCNSLFIPLQHGDTGVRQATAVTITGDDYGLFALVLVRPLATMVLRPDALAPVEYDFLRDAAGMPRIDDNAFLGLVLSPGAGIAGYPVFGVIETAWR